MDIEGVVLGSSYAGIFFLMIANSFYPPISSQILYIIVGYFISTGFLALIPAVAVGTLGNTLGNILLYEAVRAKGIDYLRKFGIFREEDTKKAEAVFKKRGLWFLFVAKLLPVIKVFVPIVAGIGKVDRRAFAGIMFSASLLWSFIFIAIGYFFGKGAGMWKSYGIILMLVAGLVVFLFYRYVNSVAIIKGLEGESLPSPNMKSGK